MAHLSRSQRDQLEILCRLGTRQTEMATLIGCSQSTVSRELARGSPPIRFSYRGHKAQARSAHRRAASYEHRKRWHDNPRVFKFVVELLRQRQSPEAIEGRMKRESPWHRAHSVSAKSIYRYIWKVAAEEGCLHLHLRRRGRRPRWFGFKKVLRTHIPNRRDISERPKIVDRKKRCGDWESDLVIGGSAIATFVERFSRYCRAVVLEDQTAKEFLRAARQTFKSVPAPLRLTMTHDNGGEIARHETITKELGIMVYCARPYHSWERGLNENTNGLIRDFFPKGTDFRTISQAELDEAIDLINNRPRRSLNFRTPKEVLDAEIKRYAFHTSD
jgi:transposase, IS30 family